MGDNEIKAVEMDEREETVDVGVLFEKLTKLEWLLKRKRIMDAHSDRPRMDPTRGRGRILATLSMKDGISTKDLSYILGIAVPTLNETLAKLDKAGLIYREPSEKDRRVILNYLTEAGREAAPNLGEKDEIDFLECLDDDEKNNLNLYLDKICDELEEELGARSEEFAEHQRRRAERLERLAEEGFPPPGPQGPRQSCGPRPHREDCHGGCGPRGHRHHHHYCAPRAFEGRPRGW